jgi:hypothetical protein
MGAPPKASLTVFTDIALNEVITTTVLCVIKARKVTVDFEVADKAPGSFSVTIQDSHGITRIHLRLFKTTSHRPAAIITWQVSNFSSQRPSNQGPFRFDGFTSSSGAPGFG